VIVVNRSSKQILVLATALTLAGGCAIFSGLGVAPKGSITVINQTKGTPICEVGVGHFQDADHEPFPVDLQPGGQVEVSAAGGERLVCLSTCKKDSYGDDTVGCTKIPIGPDKPQTIVVVEDKENLPPEEGKIPDTNSWLREDGTYAVFNIRQIKDWKGGPRDAFGDIIPDMYTIMLDNPVCNKVTEIDIQDNKGHSRGTSANPGGKSDITGKETPVYLKYAAQGSGKQPWIFDLPAGIYQFRVKDECSGIELVSEEHAEGQTDVAKPIGLDHEVNQEKKK
jgi:hypothetical protein